MKPDNTIAPYNRNTPPNSEPTANLPQQERIRHNKLARTTIPIVMLFFPALFPQAVTTNNPAPIIALSIGLGVCILALFLNQRGFTKISGILILTAVYTGITFTMLHYPSGLTASDLHLLDLTIIPDVLVLAFFSVNSLFPIVCLNTIQTWAILTYGPHDSTLVRLLQTTPFEIFSHVYILQLITAVVLYLWVRSTEHALAHADLVEEIAASERQEKEFQQQELEKKRQLDDGIQQILQTHVAIANGDLNARAPLHPDHDLWQIAVALNNLIGRLQSQGHTIHELKRLMSEENKRTNHSSSSIPKTTDQFPTYEQTTRQFSKLERTTSQFPKLEQTTGQFPKLEQTTDQHPKLEQTTGQHPKYKQTTGQFPKFEQTTGQHPKLEQTTDQHPKHQHTTGQFPKDKRT